MVFPSNVKEPPMKLQALRRSTTPQQTYVFDLVKPHLLHSVGHDTCILYWLCSAVRMNNQQQASALFISVLHEQYGEDVHNDRKQYQRPKQGLQRVEYRCDERAKGHDEAENLHQPDCLRTFRINRASSLCHVLPVHGDRRVGGLGFSK